MVKNNVFLNKNLFLFVFCLVFNGFYDYVFMVMVFLDFRI